MPKPTITEFLEARIAEDEAAAKAATRGKWIVDDDTYPDYIHVAGGGYVIRGGEFSAFDEAADAAHITRHDPARVLAECAAKRAIIDYHAMLLDQHGEVAGYHATGMRIAIRKLAAVYASHPDYQQEWKL